MESPMVGTLKTLALKNKYDDSFKFLNINKLLAKEYFVKRE